MSSIRQKKARNESHYIIYVCINRRYLLNAKVKSLLNILREAFVFKLKGPHYGINPQGTTCEDFMQREELVLFPQVKQHEMCF